MSRRSRGIQVRWLRRQQVLRSYHRLRQLWLARFWF